MRRFAIALALLLAGAAVASLAPAEVVQRGHLRISFDGELAPKALPRSALAPVKVSVAVKVDATHGSTLPQLREIALAINRHGRFSPAGLPICRRRQIQPATNEDALRACASSLVGEGSFSSKVLLPESSPFPSRGKLYAFNGRLHGHPAILAHVYGLKPIPTSYTIPFLLASARGTYGTKLSASLPAFTSNWGYITGISLKLGRVFSAHGSRRSYISAGCPAPNGLRLVAFRFARATLSFAGQKPLTQTLTRSCRAKG
jgi:hypothetical protein